jgi:hypothetical protein
VLRITAHRYSLLTVAVSLACLRVKYHYIRYWTDTRCHGHKMQVFDWEIAQAYRNWSREKPLEWREMFLKEFDYKVRHFYDSLFFLGTLVAYPKNWIIGGIFFAPKQRPLPTLWS